MSIIYHPAIWHMHAWTKGFNNWVMVYILLPVTTFYLKNGQVVEVCNVEASLVSHFLGVQFRVAAYMHAC
jgi:hypothetical protein